MPKETLIEKAERRKLPKPPTPPPKRTISEDYFDAGSIPVKWIVWASIGFIILIFLL